jgi:geranylgeranyl diphosphate synthase, type II
MVSFDLRVQSYRDAINDALETTLPVLPAPADKVREAAYYSLAAGGKRIRPILCLSFAEMFDITMPEAMPFACAIEMIHTYSLIHDDLPGMDNDDYRRGRPTCHVVYGEGMAILAGDALLNRSYEILLQHCLQYPDPRYRKAAALIAASAGMGGMIGGQSIDISSEGKPLTLPELETMHRMKTGALMKAPILVAGFLADVEEDIMNALQDFAESIGLAFQVRDDILDVGSESEELGKTIGKDARSGKSTTVSLLGMTGAKHYLQETTDRAFLALKHLSDAGYDTELEREMTHYLLNRRN